MAARIHLTAADEFSTRLYGLLGERKGIYTVGSISIGSIDKEDIAPWSLTRDQFDVPFDEFILGTVHPETERPEVNSQLIEILLEAIGLGVGEGYKFIFTGSNCDVYGDEYNAALQALAVSNPESVFFIQNFGRSGYFSALRQCTCVFGNTSSGILEAASFGKFVVNVGERQRGRLRSRNVRDVGFNSVEMFDALREVSQLGNFRGHNVYSRPDTVQEILKIIKNDHF